MSVIQHIFEYGDWKKGTILHTCTIRICIDYFGSYNSFKNYQIFYKSFRTTELNIEVPVQLKIPCVFQVTSMSDWVTCPHWGRLLQWVTCPHLGRLLEWVTCPHLGRLLQWVTCPHLGRLLQSVTCPHRGRLLQWVTCPHRGRLLY